MTLKKNILFAVIVFIGITAHTRQAYAHATPIIYAPASSSLVEKLPERVRIYFSERIEPAASDISVLGPDGTPVSGTATVDAGNGTFFSAGLRDAGAGTYTVVWQVVSADDGHFTKGAYIFSVGKETQSSAQTAGQIQIQHITSIPQATVMWIELVGQSLLVGVLLVLFIWRLICRRFAKDISADDAKSLRRRTNIMVVTGLVCIFAGIISLLVLKTFDLEELRGAGFIPTLKIFIATLDGTHALIRALLAVLFAAIFFRFRFRGSDDAQEKLSKKNFVLMAIICLIALSRARVSHSAATTFFPDLSIVITALHLLAKELWVGGVAALIAALLPVVMKKKQSAIVISSLTLFSRLMSIVLGVVGVTGVYIVWLDLKKPEYLFASEWGGRFIILSLFGLLLFAARLFSQMASERMAVKYLSEPSGARAARGLSWSYKALSLEALLGLAALFVTSFLIITTPPYPPTRFGFEKHVINQRADTALTVDPYEPDNMLITITDQKDSGSSAISDVIVRVTEDEKGIGPLVVSGIKRFPGGYLFPKNIFSLPGTWRVNIIVQRPDVFDATAAFTIDYPNEIDRTRIDPEHRSFGLFELLLVIGALGAAGIALWLYRLSSRLYGACVCVYVSGVAPSLDSSRTIIRPFKRWIIAVCGSLLIFTLIWFSYDGFAKTAFEKQCERDGNFWLQAVPMRDGVALSPDTITGCTLNIGLYHFPDSREHAFFTRPRQSTAEVITNPAIARAGIPTDIAVRLHAVERGKNVGPIEDLGIYHDRILHMIIVGEDLKTFAHIHPEDLGPVTEQMKKDGVFPLKFTFPKAGRYAIVINYVQGGKELSQQSSLMVEGDPKMEKNADAAADASIAVLSMQTVDGYRIALETPPVIAANAMTKLTYTIEKDGKKLTDLEPYLGAAMHLAIVRVDLGRVIHSHGQPYLPGSAFFQQLFQNYVNYHSHFVPDHFGPKIQARIAFPQSGFYEIFGEFKQGGRVITSRFTVKVE